MGIPGAGHVVRGRESTCWNASLRTPWESTSTSQSASSDVPSAGGFVAGAVLQPQQRPVELREPPGAGGIDDGMKQPGVFRHAPSARAAVDEHSGLLLPGEHLGGTALLTRPGVSSETDVTSCP
jgi:hypothetical protein